MAQLRRSNRRAPFENCQGHELTVIPTTRKPAEDFCPVQQRLVVKVTDQKARIRYAGKKVVSKATQENIDSLLAAKDNLKYSQEMLMTHLLECDTCS